MATKYDYMAGHHEFEMGYLPTQNGKNFEVSANRPTGFVLSEEDKAKKLLILDGDDAITALANKFKAAAKDTVQTQEHNDTSAQEDNIKYYTVKNGKGQETTQVVNGKVVNIILIPKALLEEEIAAEKQTKTITAKTVTVSYFGATGLALIKDATRIKPCVASMRQAERQDLDRGSGINRIAALGDPTIEARKIAQVKDKVYDLNKFKVEYRKLISGFNFNTLNDGDILTVYKDKVGLGSAQAAVLIDVLRENDFNVLVIK